jgi:ABC-2 type transport system ATP-binding protein
MTDDYVVNVHGLNKSFAGKPAVIDVSLQIKRGEIFGFLGPNGSGKTTTIRMLCGLMTPDSGQGQCLGYDISQHSPQIKQLVGYVPQIFSLYQDLTVKENLEFISRAYEEHDYRERVKNITTELGLDHNDFHSRLLSFMIRSCCCLMSQQRVLILKHVANFGIILTISQRKEFQLW